MASATPKDTEGGVSAKLPLEHTNDGTCNTTNAAYLDSRRGLGAGDRCGGAVLQHRSIWRCLRTRHAHAHTHTHTHVHTRIIRGHTNVTSIVHIYMTD